MKLLSTFFFIFIVTSCNKLSFSKKNAASNDINVGAICAEEETNDDGFQDGSGTEENPYRICTFEHLDNVRNFPNAYFKLDSDLDLEDQDFEPILELNATFDGQGYVIRNFSYSDDDDSIAFIIHANSSTKIVNLHFENINLNSGVSAGGIVVNAVGSLINACSVQGSLTGAFGVGGIISNSEENTIVANSFFIGSLTATGDATLLDAGAAGIIALGGILGFSNETISIQNSYSYITSFSFNNSLGSPGHFFCDAGLYCAGEFIGLGIEASAVDSYYVNNALEDTFADLLGVDSINLTQLRTQSTFDDWDFEDIWEMGETHPVLMVDTENIDVTTEGFTPNPGGGGVGSGNCVASDFDSGDGLSEPSAYIISTLYQMNTLRNCVDGLFYKLNADIDIGEDTEPFDILPSLFDGQGHTLTWSLSSSYSWNVTGNPHVGLFPELGSAGVIKDLTLMIDDFSPSSFSETPEAVGTLVGSNQGTIQNVNVTIMGELSFNIPEVSIGGVVGNNEGTINGVEVIIAGTANLKAIADNSMLGGIVGLTTGSVLNSEIVIHGIVETTSEESSTLGGIVGYAHDAILTNNSIGLTNNIPGLIRASGGNDGYNMIGGYAGLTDGTTSITGGIVTIESEISSSGASKIGGVVGEMEEMSTLTNITVNLESTGEISSTGSVAGSYDSVGGVVGHMVTGLPSSNITVNIDGDLSTTFMATTIGGAVGKCEAGILSNIEVNINSNSTLSTTGMAGNIGGVAGFSGCQISGTVGIANGASLLAVAPGFMIEIGGAVGRINGSNSILDVDATIAGTLSGEVIGGLAGFLLDGDIASTSSVTISNTGLIEGSNVGGLVAYASSSGTVGGAVFIDGALKSAGAIGGIAGGFYTGTLTNFSVNISATGIILSNASANIGGAVGLAASNATINGTPGCVTNSGSFSSSVPATFAGQLIGDASDANVTGMGPYASTIGGTWLNNGVNFTDEIGNP